MLHLALRHCGCHTSCKWGQCDKLRANESSTIDFIFEYTRMEKKLLNQPNLMVRTIE